MLINKLPGWDAFLTAAQGVVLEHLAQAVEADAKTACPVRTGTLRASIEHEVVGDTARVGSNVTYAGYVEEGTRKMAAQPYLRPALYRVRGPQ